MIRPSSSSMCLSVGIGLYSAAINYNIMRMRVNGNCTYMYIGWLLRRVFECTRSRAVLIISVDDIQ